MVSGSPFISYATRTTGSIAFSRGIDSVYPSTLVSLMSSAPFLTPARRSRSRSGTPFHRALLIRLPPTGLEIHSSVCICSAAGIALNSSRVSLHGLSTIPARLSCQLSADS